MVPPAVSFLSSNAFPTCGHLWLHMNSWIVFSNSVKNVIEIF